MAIIPKRKRRPIFHRRKVCRFCVDNKLGINDKDVNTLRHFITERGKIVPAGLGQSAPSTQNHHCHQAGPALGANAIAQTIVIQG